jgi:excisionase family DNA binding protein
MLEVLIVTLFTPSEAAEKLKVKTSTVIRMFDAGALPGIILRQGERKRVIRFRDEALEKFITSRETQNVPEEVA